MSKEQVIGKLQDMLTSMRMQSQWERAAVLVEAIQLLSTPSASAQQAAPVEIDWQHLYNEMAKKYASACNEIARLDVLDSEYRSKDGSICATDAVGGVIDLFPGADRQALNALADLLCRPVAAHAPSASPVALTDAEILELWTGDPMHSRPVMGKNKVLAFARALLAAPQSMSATPPATDQETPNA